MKILVPCKRVSDPDNANKVKVSADGTTLSAEGLEYKPNLFDDWAVETALRLTENATTGERTGEVVVVSIGASESLLTMRQFLAMGADKGVLVEADEQALDSLVVADILKGVVAKEQPDLVLMGKQSADGESGATGQMLAELLTWPMATGAMTIQKDGEALVVGREVDGGKLTLKANLPAVVTVTDQIIKPQAVNNGATAADHSYPESDSGRFASLKGIMKAKKKPVDNYSLADLGVEATATTSYISYELPEGRTGSATFVESVSELVEKLKNEARVIA